MRPLANLLAAQSILLCQSGRQGANHFRLSEYKSSNTEKLSDFSSHKVVIAQSKNAQLNNELARVRHGPNLSHQWRAIKMPTRLCEPQRLARVVAPSYRRGPKHAREAVKIDAPKRWVRALL
jgi:hypothetical protein